MKVTPGVAGRALLLTGFAIWNFSLITAPIGEASANVIHFVNLPIHEAGHFIFAPFGDYIMRLGGSLNQVLVPVVARSRPQPEDR